MKLNYKDHFPAVNPDAFIAQGAMIIGKVTIDSQSSIWYNCVLRGDVDSIIIGKGTNIQDLTTIHSSRFNGPTIIGDNVTVGHNVVLHACKINNFGFIGMHATIMDNVIVESYGFVAAGAVVTPGKVIKTNQLWAGVPAKHIRDITKDELWLIEDSAEHYIKLAINHKNI